MLQRLHAAASARGFSAIVCPDPEHAERIQHLLLPELGLGFVTSREGMAYTGPVPSVRRSSFSLSNPSAARTAALSSICRAAPRAR